ncbi:MAG: TetR/AcrR family transcriptional regulator [Microbacteriaceae bacterium]|nr:TetR/AcrR family transcriptional regulator [Burkholderiaceae bacterium]
MSKKSALAKLPLGRPRGFDVEAALRIAIDVFWQQGYEATSLEALSHAMGLSRSSFYACFGSKHALLMAAVQRYADDRYATLVERVAASADPRQAVQAMLAVIADVDGGTRGCLFVNAVSELAPGDAALLALAQAHTARVGALMTTTLRRLGCAEGEASERAGALLALVMGVTTLRKTGVPPSQLVALLNQADPLIPRPPLSQSTNRKHP